MLKICSLSFKYPHKQKWLFSKLDFEVNRGDTIAIKGASGSGKSTLLYLMAGVIPRHWQGEISGSIIHDDINHPRAQLAELAPYISLVMQNPQHQLFFPIVEQELAFGPENLKLDRKEIHSRIDKALKILEIEDLRYKYIDRLSFGQKKMIALAAIFCLQPQILLLDEITNGLAENRHQNVITLINEYCQSGKAVVFAEHDTVLQETANKTINL